MKFVVLYTDVVLWSVVLLFALYVRHVLRTDALRQKWRGVLRNRTATASAAVLAVFFLIALADSVHYRPRLEQTGGSVAYDTQTVSLMDTLIGQRIAGRERSYSAPFAFREFDKTTKIIDGKPIRNYHRLNGVDPSTSDKDIGMKRLRQVEVGVVAGLGAVILFWVVLSVIAAKASRCKAGVAFARLARRDNPWRPVITVALIVVFLAAFLGIVWPHWHVLGTDTTGNDVLYVALKSVRTAMVIGILSILATLPFAVVLGICAGYFKGWVDDLVQYVYTTISSIPSVLLIAASVLMIQVFIDKNPGLYETGLERADLRLFLLALIIGVTGWAGLARLLRAETMKVSAMDFVSAAKAFGVGHWRIMMRHVLPNVMHIVLIVAVLDFSGIVLYEAVLSYVGVGVDPVMESFGSMINAAAVEMSRSPMIWWNLLGSFLFMVTMVLAANLFASGVREAFDPRSDRQG